MNMPAIPSSGFILALTLVFGGLGCAVILYLVWRLRKEVQERQSAEREMRLAVQLAESQRQALRESEERLRTICDNDTFGIIVANALGLIEDFNPGSERIFGFAKPDVLGKNVNLLMPEPYHSEHDGHLKNYLSSGQSKVIGKGREVLGLRSNGEVFPMELFVGAVNWQDHQSLIGFIHDITDRKRSEERARENEERFLQLADNVNTVFWISELDRNQLLYISPAYENIWGRSRVEMYQDPYRQWLESIIPADRDRVIAQAMSRPAHQVLHQEYRILHPKLGERWILDRTFPVCDAHGKPYRVAGVADDITDRKRQEANAKHFASIVQSSDDAIISMDLEGTITSWNPHATAMFGYSSAEMLGKSIGLLIPPHLLDEDTAIRGKIVIGEKAESYETLRACKDGSLLDVSVALSPIYDEAGEIIGFSKIARDNTKHKRAEQELKAARHAAEAASHAKSEFLANMSHEIRTPMNAIIGLAQLVLETELSPKQQDYLEKIQASSLALLGILNDILDLSKIESGHMVIEAIEFEPEALLQGVSDLYVIRAEEKSLELFIDISSNLPRKLRGDPMRIRQVLGNLLSNAIKFTQRGEIVLRTEIVGERNHDLLLCLSVRDTGIGLSEQEISRLFQAFTQADTSITRKYGGTGLGLAISKQLVQLMGGDITVTSVPGEGSTFAFTVCCGRASWDSARHPISVLPIKRALVVDDQETSRLILREILESWKFQVAEAECGAEALSKVATAEALGQPYELLLLDWHMDEMNGLDVAARLQHRETPKIPTIIMVTAHDKEQLLQEANAVDAHPAAVLTKPVLPSNLCDTLLQVYGAEPAKPVKPGAQRDAYAKAQPLRDMEVLLVEDNDINRQVATEFLEKAGLRVSVAVDGKEAVVWVKKKTFAAVLMDLQMPVMDGYEAARQIRKLPQGQGLPIIAMTAAAMEHDRAACLKAGMDDHVSKPINPQTLIDTLLHWLAPHHAPDTPEAEAQPHDVGDWHDLASALPGFELRNIMTILKGERQRYLAMLSTFHDKFGRAVDAIGAAIANGDTVEACKQLHTLNGVAGNLGAKELHRACVQLEHHLKAGQQYAETLANWQAIFNQNLLEIATFLAHDPTRTDINGADPHIFNDCMRQADELLAADGFLDDKLLAQLQAHWPSDAQAQFAAFVRHVEDTDYPQARAVLKPMLDNGAKPTPP